MSKKNIIKGSTLYFISKISEYLLGFIFVVLATRILGETNYGLIALGVTLLALINTFGTFGLGFVAKKNIAGEINNSKKAIFASMIIINSFFTILLFLLFFFGRNFISNQIFNKPSFSPILKIISFAIIFLLPLSLISEILNAQKKVNKYFIINISKSSFKLLLLITIFFLPDKTLAVSLSIPLSIFFTLLLSIYFIFDERISPKFINIKANIIETSNLGFQFLLVGSSYFLLSQIDKLMLGILDTAKSVGIYAISSSIAIVPSLFHSSMSTNFMPIISDLYKKNDIEKIKDTYYFSNLFVAFINTIFIIFLIIMGQIIFKTIFGLTSNAIYYVFCLLCIKYYIGTIIGPTGELLNMLDKQKIDFINTLVILLLNIILNIILIKLYSIYGAIFATLISVITLNIIQIIEINKFYNFFVLKKYHLKIILPPLFIFIIYFIFIHHKDNLFLNIIYFIISELLFISLIWLTLEKNYKNKLTLLIKNNLKL